MKRLLMLLHQPLKELVTLKTTPRLFILLFQPLKQNNLVSSYNRRTVKSFCIACDGLFFSECVQKNNSQPKYIIIL